jgi:hypothetical protein
MMQMSQDGGIERCDIDAVDPKWKNRDLWAKTSLPLGRFSAEKGGRRI